MKIKRKVKNFDRIATRLARKSIEKARAQHRKRVRAFDEMLLASRRSFGMEQGWEG